MTDEAKGWDYSTTPPSRPAPGLGPDARVFMSFEEWLSGPVNVLDYGAGLTYRRDSSSAIQAAIDDAALQGRVLKANAADPLNS